MATPEDRLAAGVREVLGEIQGPAPSEVRLRAIPGGASRQTFRVDADGARYVLRRDPPGAASLMPLDVEVKVVVATGNAGVPVPRPLRYEPPGGRFETAGYLMEHVEGESVASRLLRRDEYAGARDALPVQLASALATIHRVEPPEGTPSPPGNPATAACDLWERELDEIGAPLPGVEAGLRKLRLTAPGPPAQSVLVHGDFRMGNLIVNGSGLRAVIDWELCHVGDPVEDLGWLCIRSWRFGNDDRQVGGVGNLDDFLAEYERSGARPPDDDRLRWWEAMGNVKWAVICARQANDHQTGRRRGHELASLGRRICEPEWDLLEIMGAAA
jgi:aminoglycoside phosphotransferase (APT) family kinase protein